MIENNKFWLKQSTFTDPYEYFWMYKNIPDSIPEICEVIHTQLIHIVWAQSLKSEISREINREDFELPTVHKMLEALNKRSEGTLLKNRTPNERIIVTCRNYALLLASILKHKGIPCRLRVGFAKYLMNNEKFIDHWICEYWDKNSNVWKLADPDAKRFGIASDEFIIANTAWLKARKRTVDSNLFGREKWWVMDYILNNICCDFLCITGNELLYEASVTISNKGYMKLDKAQIEILDVLAGLLINPEDNLNTLLELSKANEFCIS